VSSRILWEVEGIVHLIQRTGQVTSHQAEVTPELVEGAAAGLMGEVGGRLDDPGKIADCKGWEHLGHNEGKVVEVERCNNPPEVGEQGEQNDRKRRIDSWGSSGMECFSYSLRVVAAAHGMLKEGIPWVAGER
jgi:hypothetical protein